MFVVMQKHSLKNCSYDYTIISFGLRNVTKIDNVLNEAFRVLKKGRWTFTA